jgi:hypothetical protein
MRRLLRFGIFGVLLGVPLAGCYVHTTDRVVARPATCTNAVWIEGHYDVHGLWIPGFWRCQHVTY